MTQIARIIKTLWETRGASPGNAVVVQLSSGGEQERTAEYYQLPGVASGPTPQDRAMVVPTASGYRVVVASHNYRVDTEVEAGQTRIYSTTADGSAVKAEIDMLPDGQMTIKNDAGAEAVLHTDGLIEAKNGSQSLKTLIDSLIDELIAFRTTGSPTNHATDPGTISNLNLIKTNFGGLLK